VPVEVAYGDGVLTVKAGRFDPAGAAGRLVREHPRLTARLALTVAGQGGQPAQEAGQRLLFDLCPEPAGGGYLLLCDGCYQAATGLEAGCEDGCGKGPGHVGTCRYGWPEECHCCGGRDRLREVQRASAGPCLPAGRPGRPGPVAPALRRRSPGPVPLGTGRLGPLARSRPARAGTRARQGGPP
jgi:hypothetical protein